MQVAVEASVGSRILQPLELRWMVFWVVPRRLGKVVRWQMLSPYHLDNICVRLGYSGCYHDNTLALPEYDCVCRMRKTSNAPSAIPIRSASSP